MISFILESVVASAGSSALVLSVGGGGRSAPRMRARIESLMEMLAVRRTSRFGRLGGLAPPQASEGLGAPVGSVLERAERRTNG